jgi:hypothetical protein
MALGLTFLRAPWLIVVPTFVLGYLAAAAFVLARPFVGRQPDIVYDCGDALVVVTSGQAEQIPLSKIDRVTVHTYAKQRITVTLREPADREITFSLPAMFNPFARSPIVDDLVERIDAARQVATASPGP